MNDCHGRDERLLTHSSTQNIKEGIEGKPVDWYSDVFDLVFADMNHSEANGLWKKELAKPVKEDVEKDEEIELLN